MYIEKASPRQDSDSLNIAHKKEQTEKAGHADTEFVLKEIP